MEHKLQSSEWKFACDCASTLCMRCKWSLISHQLKLRQSCLIHHTVLTVFAIILMQKHRRGITVPICLNSRLHQNYFYAGKKRWLSKGGCTHLNVFTPLGFSYIIMHCQLQSSHGVYNKGRRQQAVTAPYRLPPSLSYKCMYFRTSSFGLCSIFATC